MFKVNNKDTKTTPMAFVPYILYKFGEETPGQCGMCLKSTIIQINVKVKAAFREVLNMKNLSIKPEI